MIKVLIIIYILSFYLSLPGFFSKAGYNALSGLIPIYNLYILFQILEISPILLIIISLGLIFSPDRSFFGTLIFVFMPFILADAYEKGKSDCIFSKLVGCQANLYEDGCILAYTDYVNEGEYAATFVDHKGKFCDIGVGNSFVRTGNSQFLYLQDGKLYKYENGQSREIASDVDVFWSQDTMKLSRITIEE